MDGTTVVEHPDVTMSRRLLGHVPEVIFFVLAGLAAFFLWPSSLGGCTTLTIVSGESMEPTYYTGDLVISRCGEPSVGDVAVYQPVSVGGGRIIHRIIDGDGESGWILQGDNNSWIDPFSPTEAEVLGTARVHVPKVGLAARWITSPWVWGSLIVMAVALLIWPRGDEDADIEAAEADGDRAPSDASTDGADTATPARPSRGVTL